MIEKRIEQLNHKIDAEQAEAESEKARADLQTEMKSRTQELQDKVDEAGKQLFCSERFTAAVLFS
tara:strand:- start:1663 stop:1857 length:195 start_codon:yes stop_codon:yes gene_type:complete